MIFGKELVQKVLAGEKTQTRRLVQSGHGVGHFRRGMVRAVQRGRGLVAVAHIRLLDVCRADLGAITFDDVLAEGFRTRADFARYWLAMHDPSRPMRAAVARDPDAVDGIDDENVLEHFTERHGGRRVWVLRFEVIREAPPVLLAARGGGGSSGRPFRSGRELGETARRHAADRPYDPWPQAVDDERAALADARGYTDRVSQALPDEPEVMDATGTVASIESAQRWQLEQLRTAARLRALPIADRVDNARRLGAAMHANVTSDLRVVERLTWSGDDERAARRLDALEGRLLSAEARILYPDRAVQEDEDRRAA